MLLNDIYLWLHEGPRPVAVAEEPQLVRRVVVAEPPAEHDNAAGNGRHGTLVEGRRM